MSGLLAVVASQALSSSIVVEGWAVLAVPSLTALSRTARALLQPQVLHALHFRRCATLSSHHAACLGPAGACTPCTLPRWGTMPQAHQHQALGLL